MPNVPPDGKVTSRDDLTGVIEQDDESIFLLFFAQKDYAAHKYREADPLIPAYSLWTDKTPDMVAFLKTRTQGTFPAGCTALSFCPTSHGVARLTSQDPVAEPIKILGLIFAAGSC